jgi:hypothetical protein
VLEGIIGSEDEQARDRDRHYGERWVQHTINVMVKDTNEFYARRDR